MDSEFTAQQLKDFAAYVKVQKSGKYNMFDPRATTAASLDSKRMEFVMMNYGPLKRASEQTT